MSTEPIRYEKIFVDRGVIKMHIIVKKGNSAKGAIFPIGRIIKDIKYMKDVIK